MDGTLVDSEPYWIQAEQAIVEDAGATWDPRIVEHMIGRPLPVSAQLMCEWFDLSATPDQVVDQMLEDVMARMTRFGIPWRPGALDLLTSLSGDGVPCALVTMSWRRMVEIVLAALPSGTFSVVITGDEVSHGKPHPEPYLKAAHELGVMITRCVAIEDSPTGVASGEAAGARMLAVEAHVDIPAAPGRSRLKTLAGLSTADLDALAGGAVMDVLGA